MTYSQKRDEKFGNPGEKFVVESLRAEGFVVEHTSMGMGKYGKDFDFKYWPTRSEHTFHPRVFYTGEVKTQESYNDTGNLWVLWENRPGGRRHTIKSCIADCFFIVCSEGIFGFGPYRLAKALTDGFAAKNPNMWTWVNDENETLAVFTGEWFFETFKPSSVPTHGTNPTKTRYATLINGRESLKDVRNPGLYQTNLLPRERRIPE